MVTLLVLFCTKNIDIVGKWLHFLYCFKYRRSWFTVTFLILFCTNYYKDCGLLYCLVLSVAGKWLLFCCDLYIVNKSIVGKW